jgi:acyl-CoA synthetase (AMP-forming)/AMP-acid ligase II
MSGNFADSVSEIAAKWPDRTALVDVRLSLTYAELDSRVTQTANLIRSLGVTEGEIVGVGLSDTADHAVMLLATARSGAVILPMDNRWTLDEKARIAKQFGLARAFVDGGHDPIDGITTITIDDRWHADVALQPATGAFPHDPDQPLLLSMSSGTTGTPKGTLSTHRAQLGRAKGGVILSNDVILMATPLYFGGGRGFTLGGLATGATVIMLPPPFNAEKLVEAATANKATYLFLVPTQLRRLMQLPDTGALMFPMLRVLVSSGAILFPEERAEIMRRLAPNLINMYSSTEGGGISRLMPEDQGERAKSVGRVNTGVTVQIVDDNDKVLPIGHVGRIRQKSATLPDGFYNNPEETRIYFKDGWYYPGDLGRLDEDNYLYLAGRAKEMIIRGGVNIYPGEIEEPLLRLPQIHDCAAVAWPSRMMGEEIAVFVVRAQPIEAPEIIEHCRKLMSAYKVPRGIFFIDELPKNAHGKVVRKELVKFLPPIDQVQRAQG